MGKGGKQSWLAWGMEWASDTAREEKGEAFEQRSNTETPRSDDVGCELKWKGCPWATIEKV